MTMAACCADVTTDQSAAALRWHRALRHTKSGRVEDGRRCPIIRSITREWGFERRHKHSDRLAAMLTLCSLVRLSVVAAVRWLRRGQEPNVGTEPGQPARHSRADSSRAALEANGRTASKGDQGNSESATGPADQGLLRSRTLLFENGLPMAASKTSMKSSTHALRVVRI